MELATTAHHFATELMLFSIFDFSLYVACVETNIIAEIC